MNANRNLRHIGLTLFTFCMPIILILVALVEAHCSSGNFQLINALSKYAIFSGMIGLMTIPGFLLHYRYWRHDKGKELILNRTYRELRSLGQVSKIQCSKIQALEVHTLLYSTPLPWLKYGYVKVILQNGNTLTITSLLPDLNTTAFLCREHGIVVEHVDSFYTWL